MCNKNTKLPAADCRRAKRGQRQKDDVRELKGGEEVGSDGGGGGTEAC